MKLLLFLILPAFISAQTNDSVLIKIEKGAVVRHAPDMSSGKAGVFQDSATVYTSNFTNDYYRINWEGKFGYVKSLYIVNKVDKKYFALWREARKEQNLHEFPYKTEFKKKPQNVKIFFKNFFAAPDKGEYESTEDYNRRTSFDSTVIYNFEIDVTPKYDADNSYFVFDVVSHFRQSYNSPDTYFLAEDRRKIRSYDGQNSFGVKANVNEYSVNKYLISEYRDQVKLYDLNDEPFINIVQFDCPKDKAKSVKNNIGVKIGVSFINQRDKVIDKDYEEPTISNPVELNTTNYYIHAKVKYIVAYNKKTNEIYNIYCSK